jgi:hypothetical protein
MNRFRTLILTVTIAFCLAYSTEQDKNATPASGSNTVIFSRVTEPREHAFSLLIPKGWQIEGGIFRVDPTAQGGPAQSIAAKLDFAARKDGAGTVMIRWLPDVLYFDTRYSPAGQMGLFPPGSNYSGMTVYPLMEQEEYVNPYTNEIEIDSNQWRYRWINENEDVIYTDDQDDNPNVDIRLNQSGFKRTPIRKRMGQ